MHNRRIFFCAVLALLHVIFLAGLLYLVHRLGYTAEAYSFLSFLTQALCNFLLGWG